VYIVCLILLVAFFYCFVTFAPLFHLL